MLDIARLRLGSNPALSRAAACVKRSMRLQNLASVGEQGLAMRGETGLASRSIKERDTDINLQIRNDGADGRLTTPQLSRGG